MQDSLDGELRAVIVHKADGVGILLVICRNGAVGGDVSAVGAPAGEVVALVPRCGLRQDGVLAVFHGKRGKYIAGQTVCKADGVGVAREQDSDRRIAADVLKRERVVLAGGDLTVYEHAVGVIALVRLDRELQLAVVEAGRLAERIDGTVLSGDDVDRHLVGQAVIQGQNIHILLHVRRVCGPAGEGSFLALRLGRQHGGMTFGNGCSSRTL